MNSISPYEISHLLYFIKFAGMVCMVRSSPPIRITFILLSCPRVLELGHTVCVIYSVYAVTVFLPVHPETTLKTFNGLISAILFDCLITLTVQVKIICSIIHIKSSESDFLIQSFFAFRIRRLAGTSHIAAICWLLAILRSFCSIFAFVEAILAVDIINYAVEWGWLITTILSLTACTDVIIAASLCYYFKQLNALSNR